VDVEGCSARYIRWSSWLSCVKLASEAGFEVWIGRGNTICDAGVTRILLPKDPKGLPSDLRKRGLRALP